ncbi:hypothetical protein [Dactylosporangium sp. CA-139066]|uniref:hypothetical protein n=1 Tax=Dactylosporangium sp. CA-139066 TaxID=3239930 RepID=UPI003D8C4C0F
MERVARSLLALQAALELTATLGLALLSGPVATIGPLLHAVLLLVLSARAHRPWAQWAVIAVEGLAIGGFALQQTLGLLPQLDATVNLTGLLTTLALPGVLCALAVRMLVRP